MALIRSGKGKDLRLSKGSEIICDTDDLTNSLIMPRRIDPALLMRLLNSPSFARTN